MKKIIYILTITISMIITCNVHALSSARVINLNGTIIRNTPGTNGTSLGTIKFNDNITILSTLTIKSESGCTAGWYKADYNGKIGYVCTSEISTSKITAKISDKDGVNARKGAGTNYDIIEKIKYIKNVSILDSKKITGKGCSGGWYKIKFNNKTQYICSNYTKTYNNTSNIFITSQTANLVNSPTDLTVYKKLNYNQSLTIYTNKLYTGQDCSSGYYKVYYNNQIKYICKSKVLNTNYNGTITTTSGANIYSKPSTSSTKILNLSYGSYVSLYSKTKYTGTGCSSGWYKIKYKGYARYICSSNLATYSQAATVENTDAVNIRSGAGTNYSIVTTLQKTKPVILQSSTLITGTSCQAGWYKIYINGKTAYICSSYAKAYKKEEVMNQQTNQTANQQTNTSDIITKTTDSGNYYLKNNWSYRIAEDYAYVRGTASTSGTLKDTLYLGTELEVTGTQATSSGCQAGWYKIKYYNSKTGYICKTMVDKYTDITKTDSSYCQELKNKGFPASYCPFLSYLHAKYPNWKFTPEKTGITFQQAVIGETGKNYTLNTYKDYLKSTTISEAGGWRTANAGYTAFMLDPRNYLNERNIFAFEQLSYDKTNHTKALVKSIFNGTWLYDDTYAGYFMNAATSYNISPVHLAARVNQEGGASKTYAGVSGTVGTTWNVTNAGYICKTNATKDGTKLKINVTSNVYSGPGTNYAKLKYPNGKVITATANDTLTYIQENKTEKDCADGWYKIKLNKSLKSIYNFYNIGAYGDNPVIRGLAAAAGYVDEQEGTPWNTHEKAIKYGANFIASGYINKGQDTMYYQKFNTGPNNYFNKYTHQYMTNILAPASESLSTYNTYTTQKTISKIYVFKIPVYNSMPTEFTTHPQVK